MRFRQASFDININKTFRQFFERIFECRETPISRLLPRQYGTGTPVLSPFYKNLSHIFVNIIMGVRECDASIGQRGGSLLTPIAPTHPQEARAEWRNG